jgi:hypothetical protein
MSTSAETSPPVAYCNCMDDIKQRLNKVDRILIGHSPMKHEGLDAEVVCLLIRKSLEQLAFSSLIAHKEAYVDVYNDFSKTWRAKQLLDRLKTVHPEFYPRPVRFSEDATPPVKHLLDAPDGFLTQEEFVFLYDCCSQAIHTWNPFTPGPRVIDTQRPLTEWVNRIKTLLDLHYVRLAGEQGVWVVQMNHPVDGKVHAFPAQ